MVDDLWASELFFTSIMRCERNVDDKGHCENLCGFTAKSRIQLLLDVSTKVKNIKYSFMNIIR